MPKCCVAVGCSNREHAGITFYRFPSDKKSPVKRKLWINAVKRQNWEPKEHDRLCSAHFLSGQKSNIEDHPDFIPSVFSYKSSEEIERKRKSLHAYERHASKRCKVTNIVKCETFDTFIDTSVGTQTDLSCSELDNIMREVMDLKRENTELKEKSRLCNTFRNEIETLKAENNHLQQEIRNLEINEETFKNNENKLKYYTGLPTFAVFLAHLNMIIEHLVPRATMSKSCQFILTLMRLRLNLGTHDLAYRFNIDQSTVSRIFSHVIDVCNARLVPVLVKWPNDLLNLRATLPRSFLGAFSKCVGIIDCFEIFIEKPKDLDARATTYSQYKSNNTIKYLIAIAPQGVVTFVSKGWGGRVSDKHLTDNCGLLEKLQPGDLLLADRGFDIQDLVGLHGAKVEIPAFTRGKSQLSLYEVESTRGLASVRIHVERVIGLVRSKYTMLNAKIPISLLQTDETTGLTTLDKVVFVSSALSNTCESVVPF